MKKSDTEQDYYMPEFTPVEKHGGYLVKREDLWCIAGVRGAKARSCWNLAQGAKGLIGVGGRHSTQTNIVARIANRLKIPCHIHTASGELTPELQAAKDAGAKLIQHRPGRNNQIVYQSRQDKLRHPDWTLVPYAVECRETLEAIANQVKNLPRNGIERIVVTVGSGVSLCGVLQGLDKFGIQVPVLGVIVGQDPSRRLDKYVPFWNLTNSVSLVRSQLAYQTHADELYLGDLLLDPVYEAKALPFLHHGDLLWCIAIRQQMEQELMRVKGVSDAIEDHRRD